MHFVDVKTLRKPIILIFQSVFFYVCQCSGRPGFNPRSSHNKDSKMVLDAFLLNTQHYRVQIKGKGEHLDDGRSTYYIYIYIYENGLKSSLAEKVIWWRHICYWWLFWPSIAKPVEDVRRLQRVLCWKIIFIWSHSMRVSWSAYELFS